MENRVELNLKVLKGRATSSAWRPPGMRVQPHS